MSGIPAELYARLYKMLDQCGPFDSDSELQPFFLDARIRPWKDEIFSNTASKKARIDALIEKLYDQYANRADLQCDYDNALARFLEVAADRKYPGDRCKNSLMELAHEIENLRDIIAIPGIPYELLRRLYNAFIDCNLFHRDVELQTVFESANIYPWRSGILNKADNPRERIIAFIQAFYNRYTARGENVLAAFLKILVERNLINHVSNRELTQLSQDIEATLPFPYILDNMLPDFMNRLYRVLVECDVFDSDRELLALFGSDELRPNRSDILNRADNPRERIAVLIRTLCDKYTYNGENKLALFLEILEKEFVLDSVYGSLRELSSEVESKFPNPSPETFAHWESALSEYRQMIAKHYSTIQIFGQSEPLSLADIYTEHALLSRPMAYRRFNIRKLNQDPGLLKNMHHISGDDILQSPDPRRLFVLGKPGAGKTTFLRHITCSLASDEASRVPIFVSLTKWADSGLELLPYIEAQFKICGMPDVDRYVIYLLKKTDQAVVLFDGLDETRYEGNQRQDTISALRSFVTHFPQVSVLITCRVSASDSVFEGFTYLEVADFVEDQIQTFVRNWFRKQPNKGETFIEEISKDQHRGLRELARQPLLLAMLCLAFSDTQTFPMRRVEIYEDALDALLRKWDSSRGIRRDKIYQGLSPGRKRQMFQLLAAETFEQGEVFLSQAYLEQTITDYLCKLPRAEVIESVDVDGAAVLRAIEAQHGILVERAHNVHSFAHHTFQEYYTAMHIIESSAGDQNAFPRLLRHAHEDRWREVILLTASRLAYANIFFQHFLCVIYTYVQGRPYLINFLKWLSQKEGNSSSPLDKLLARRAWYTYLTSYITYDIQELVRAKSIVFEINEAHKFCRSLEQACIYVYPGQAHNLVGELHRIEKNAQNLEFPSDFIQAQNFARRLVIGYVPDIETELNKELKRLSNLSYAFLQDFVKKRYPDLEHILTQMRNVVNEAIDVLDPPDDSVLNILVQRIGDLMIPSKDGTAREWKLFSLHLQAIMDTYSNIIHGWNFNEEQSEVLENYQTAADLLIECLDLAYVRDREAIEAHLYHPPPPQDPLLVD